MMITIFPLTYFISYFHFDISDIYIYFLVFLFLGLVHRVAHTVAHGPRPRFCPHPITEVFETRDCFVITAGYYICQICPFRNRGI